MDKEKRQMNHQKVWCITLCVFFLPLLSSNCLAGRPVFYDFKMEDLVARSHVIAEVKREQPNAVQKTFDWFKWLKGCSAEYWSLKLSKVLLLQWKLRLSPGVKMYPMEEEPVEENSLSTQFGRGKTVNVIVNEVSLTDCIFRKKNPSGASFPAERYIPSNSDIPEDKTFLIFLQIKRGEPHLTVTNAFEDLTKEGEVMGILKNLAASNGGRLPSGRMDCGPSTIDCLYGQYCNPYTGKWECTERR